MMHIGERFKAVRKQRKFTQMDFSHICDRRTLGRFESGERNMETGRLVKCLEHMGMTFGEFMALNSYPETEQIYSVPQYDWGDLKNAKRTPIAYTPFEEGAPKKAFSLLVTDDSMTGGDISFPKGCKIIVEPSRTAKDGDLVIVKHQSGFYFRKVNGRFKTPENKSYEPLLGGRVIGHVIGIVWSALI
ncbi:XRE family transcriptional regulator [Vibrio hannami]|uniref:helix-turn-helix domain-containing protein n=1 Tax=Vibrio hannami TaxID=2717094 RepID=UPI00240EBC75|nr:XRE family transcriptional regulator [Vibrio hannami]MDG3089170.1 XRE family transcriptional regulator [Vibrio hannami]